MPAGGLAAGELPRAGLAAENAAERGAEAAQETAALAGRGLARERRVRLLRRRRLFLAAAEQMAQQQRARRDHQRLHVIVMRHRFVDCVFEIAHVTLQKLSRRSDGAT